MLRPWYCSSCRKTYDKAVAFLCPYCGAPRRCPDPLCTLDISNADICTKCPKIPDPLEVAVRRPRGGARQGAGAPLGNLNRLVHGRRSDNFRLALGRLIEDSSLHIIFLILARFVEAGDFPQDLKATFKTVARRVRLYRG